MYELLGILIWYFAVNISEITAREIFFDHTAQSFMLKYNPSKCKIHHNSQPLVDVRMLDVYSQIDFDKKRAISPDKEPTYPLLRVRKPWSDGNQLQVFFILHSHCDAGWKNTFYEYYDMYVKSILDGMLSFLPENSSRKFIWAEMSFLSVWWTELSLGKRRMLRELIHDDQLEIVTGGWVVADEAITCWQSLLMELTEGHQWLAANLNVLPRNAWTIDAFGLSATMAFLLKKAGIENLAVQRVHYAVKKYLGTHQNLEFYWRQLWDTEGSTDLFTHIMPFHGYAPQFSCGPHYNVCCIWNFEVAWTTCESHMNRQDKKEYLLLEQLRLKSELYKTNTIFVPWGNDFTFVSKMEWKTQYDSLQKSITLMNNVTDFHIKVQFGTLNDYFEAIHEHKQNGTIFPTLSGDFFTYSDEASDYWSGFYSTRPFYKRMERVLLAYIRSAEILTTVAATSARPGAVWFMKPDTRIREKLSLARQTLSLFQHHDSITGTSNDYVANAAGIKLLNAMWEMQHLLQLSVNILLRRTQEEPTIYTKYYKVDDLWKTHNTLPKRMLLMTHGRKYQKIVMFNPLTFSREEVVFFIVATPFIKVTDANACTIPSQISPILEESGWTFQRYFKLGFICRMAPLSLAVFYIVAAPESATDKAEFSQVIFYQHNDNPYIPRMFTIRRVSEDARHLTIRTSRLAAHFNETGFLRAVEVGHHEIDVGIDFARYDSYYSGAYLFQPMYAAYPVILQNISIKVVKGSIWSTVTLKSTTDVQSIVHSVSIYETNGIDGMTFDIQNVIELNVQFNTELVMRMFTSIKNGDEYFTDLNGYQMIKRKYLFKLPIEGNFYPMSTIAYFEDDQTRLTLAADSSHGVSSLQEGHMEVMLHRRPTIDDNRGLEKPFHIFLPAKSAFRLLVEERTSMCDDINHVKEVRNLFLNISGRPHSGFNTIFASGASQAVLNPLIALVAVDHSTRITAKTYFPMTNEYGMDIFLATMRVNVFANFSFENIGVVLHRQMLDICYTSQMSRRYFPISNGQVQLSILFPYAPYLDVYNASITFAKIGEKLELNRKYVICPMDIEAFLLTSDQPLNETETVEENFETETDLQAEELKIEEMYGIPARITYEFKQKSISILFYVVIISLVVIFCIDW